MKSLNGVAVAALIAAVAAPAAFAQEAVQWRVEDGGNGHWYAVAEYSVGTSHATATSLATALGAGMVSIGGATELEFLESMTVPYGPFSGFILGGHQAVGAPDYSEPSGGWRWDDGTPWSFTNWDCGVCATQHGSGWWCQPDNYINQHRIVGVICMGRLVWDDGTEPLAEIRAIYEWSADCNGDGIVDYGQILDGTFEDANQNGVPDCCNEGVSCDPCPGDVNFDGQVNGADISVLLGFWGLTGKPNNADINGDGTVNGADLAELLGSWGECP